MKTFAEFHTWLELLPPETEFCQHGRCVSCPIAKFTGQWTNLFDWSLAGWAREFMRRYDANQSTSLTEALAIARSMRFTT